jgi:hypothetical protein
MNKEPSNEGNRISGFGGRSQGNPSGVLTIDIGTEVKSGFDSRSSICIGNFERYEHQLPCMVRAVEVSTPNLDILKYVSANIVRAPSELPDGVVRGVKNLHSIFRGLDRGFCGPCCE